MNITIRTIDSIIFSDAAQEINLPGLHGNVGIRPNHSPMSVILTEGKIHVIVDSDTKEFSAQNGIAQVSNNSVDILLL